MIKVNEEIKTEFFEDVDAAVNKFVIEMLSALSKMLIKSYPEKTEKIKAYVQKRQAETVAMIKENIIPNECDFEEDVGIILDAIDEAEIEK